MKLYRVYDHTTQNILANALTLEQASQVLKLTLVEAPGNDIEIESYTPHEPKRKT